MGTRSALLVAMNPEAQMTVEDWEDLATYVQAAMYGVTIQGDLDRLQLLREKCVVRARALREGRVTP